MLCACNCQIRRLPGQAVDRLNTDSGVEDAEKQRKSDEADVGDHVLGSRWDKGEGAVEGQGLYAPTGELRSHC